MNDSGVGALCHLGLSQLDQTTDFMLHSIQRDTRGRL